MDLALVRRNMAALLTGGTSFSLVVAPAATLLRGRYPDVDESIPDVDARAVHGCAVHGRRGGGKVQLSGTSLTAGGRDRM